MAAYFFTLPVFVQVDEKQYTEGFDNLFGKYDVKYEIDKDYVVKLEGREEDIEKSLTAVKAHIRLVNFHLALQIITLDDKHKFKKYIEIDKQFYDPLVYQNDGHWSRVCEIEKQSNTVIRLDRRGYASIFGDSYGSVQMAHKLLVEFCSKFGDKSKNGTASEPSTTTIDSNTSDESKTTLETVVESSVVCGSSANESVWISSGQSAHSLDGIEGKIVRDKSIKGGFPSKRVIQSRQTTGAQNLSIIPTGYTYHERVIIDCNDTGRLIGKYGKTKKGIQDIFSVYINVVSEQVDEASGMVPVNIYSKNVEDGKKASTYITNFLADRKFARSPEKKPHSQRGSSVPLESTVKSTFDGKLVRYDPTNCPPPTQYS